MSSLVLILLDLSQTAKNLYNNLFLPALGGLMVIMLVYGGILVMTGSGSDDIRQVGKGKRVIIATIVGGAIVFLAAQLALTLTNNFQ
jgi:hypothetical protein